MIVEKGKKKNCVKKKKIEPISSTLISDGILLFYFYVQ